ncbi:MAG: F-type H+-transporting ATPase subunit epsilon [Thermoleophilaceae bacterium]|nr:F-type H+-transporting ATPase subunit epsilon [Thermoleophilaceae bacterium]
MAHKTFPVEVLTPEGKAFEGEVEMLSTRTNTGSIGIRANHAPLMAILDPTELRLYESEGEPTRFAQGEGYLQVVNNSALVLVDEVMEPDKLNKSDIESRLKEAEQGLESAEDDSEDARRCERNVRRYKAFLEVAEGS